MRLAESVRRRSRRRGCVLVLAGAVLGLAAGHGAVADASSRPRMLLVLPFATTDLARDEQWMGEGVAQSLTLALSHLPGLIQIERARLRGLAAPETWDDPAALAAARAVNADLTLYGEVRREGGDLTIVPKYVEVRGERGESASLGVITVGEGTLLDRLRGLPLAYARALKVPAGDAESARVTKWASPTGNLRAFEAFVRGRQASYRGTQEGNEQAVELLARAVELDAQFVVAQYTLGTVHQALGNRWKAAAQYRASIQLDAGYPDPYKALGDLFVTAPRRLFDQAIEAYNKAIELRPFFAEAYVGLGDAKAAKGDVDGAVAAYQKALGHNPLNPKVHASLGKIYYTEKNLYYESVQAYQKAIDLDGRYLEARMGLAEVYEEKGLYQEAIAEYRKVVEQDSKNTGALYNLAIVYEKVDPREAISLWERYIQLAGSLPSEKDWVDVARLHLRKLRSQFPDKTN